MNSTGMLNKIVDTDLFTRHGAILSLNDAIYILNECKGIEERHSSPAVTCNLILLDG